LRSHEVIKNAGEGRRPNGGGLKLAPFDTIRDSRALRRRVLRRID
jgi:hypothetical protein